MEKFVTAGKQQGQCREKQEGEILCHGLAF
jgi:hypothetical protein